MKAGPRRMAGQANEYYYMYTVYIIRSIPTGRYNVGCTDDVKERIQKHNSKKVRSTKSYAPYKLVRMENFSTIREARRRELQPKKTGHLERHDRNHGLIV